MSEAGNCQYDKHASHMMTQYRRHVTARSDTCCVLSKHAKCMLRAVSQQRNQRCRLMPPCTDQHGNPLRLPPSPCTAWPIRGAAALSEFWPLEASMTAVFSLGYALSGLASRSSQSKHLAAERLRLVLQGRKTGFPAKSPLLEIISGTGNELRAAPRRV